MIGLRRRAEVATCVAIVCTSAGVACGPTGSSPVLDPIDDSVAYVGSEFRLELLASDEDVDALHFQYANDDLDDLASRAEVRNYGAGRAVFVWTPVAADVGDHPFDFSVNDEQGNTDRETIMITVRSGVGENNAPIFREPLGTGTTLDLSMRDCLDLDIVVEDTDSADVTITQETPLIEGAQLNQDTGASARWHWCPTPAQIMAQDRYGLILGASDGDNPMTVKNFLIVLRKQPKPDCPGEAPVITHSPTDESTLVGLTIAAEISDAEGLKGDPLFYYALTQPLEPVDVSSMTMVTMLHIEGNTWAADVPNPVASMPAGSMKSLYYVIVAQDDDDPTGDCDHLTQAPASGSYKMTVTNPGGTGGLGLCEECTADVQCGGANDNCVRMGTEGKYYCFKACDDAPGACPTDYYCSITSFTSIDGAMARQCIPNDYSCTDGGTTTCTDDDHEPNDARTSVASAEPIAPGTLAGLVSCPDGAGQDEDWYRFVVGADAQVTLTLDGSNPPDLDLQLVDADGMVIERSTGLTSDETVTHCLTPGTYYARVYSVLSPAQTTYTLTYAQTAMSCGAAMCVDDGEEPDDSTPSARRPTIAAGAPYLQADNMLCAANEDWVRVYLDAGATVYATCAFTQITSAEDLDLHLYQGETDLTPCTEAEPFLCDVTNGQGSNSNENFSFTVTTAGYYYVVVHGWEGSQNHYDLCVGIASGDCPLLP